MAIGRKVSPARFLGAVAGVVGGVMNMFGGDGGAAAQQKKDRAELEKQKKLYKKLDTSNLQAGVKNAYADIQTDYENVYEDLTVNQQQAQFQAQQGAQQRANIMQGLRGSAGSSGIAGLAQSLANQGQRQAQQASASIGQQEAQNQRIRQGEAGRLQTMERQGESQAEATRLGGQAQSRSLDWQKQSTLFGMSQQRLAGANKAISSANQAMWGGIGKIGGAIGGAALAGGGIGGGGGVDGVDPSMLKAPNMQTYQMDPNQIKDRPIVTRSTEDIYGTGDDFGIDPNKNPYSLY